VLSGSSHTALEGMLPHLQITGEQSAGSAGYTMDRQDLHPPLPHLQRLQPLV